MSGALLLLSIAAFMPLNVPTIFLSLSISLISYYEYTIKTRKHSTHDSAFSSTSQVLHAKDGVGGSRALNDFLQDGDACLGDETVCCSIAS